jgi:hypothetical protein
MSKVSIGKTVDYKTLERALINAAEEVGWKARFQDQFYKSYKLGSVEQVQDYNATQVFLKGRLFNAMQIRIYGKRPTNSFHLWAGFPFGIASERRIQGYLSAVSRNL